MLNENGRFFFTHIFSLSIKNAVAHFLNHFWAFYLIQTPKSCLSSMCLYKNSWKNLNYFYAAKQKSSNNLWTMICRHSDVKISCNISDFTFKGLKCPHRPIFFHWTSVENLISDRSVIQVLTFWNPHKGTNCTSLSLCFNTLQCNSCINHFRKLQLS